MLFNKLCFFVAAALAFATGRGDGLLMLLAWTDPPRPPLRMVFDVITDSPTPFDDSLKMDTTPFDDALNLDAETFAPLNAADGEKLPLHNNTTVVELLGMQPLNFVLQIGIVTSFGLAFFIVFLLITRKQRVAKYAKI